MKLAASLVLTCVVCLGAAHPALQEAQKLLQERKFVEAERVCREKLAELEATGQSDSLEAAEYLNVLTGSIARLGRVQEAVPLAQRSLAIVERGLPADDIRRTGSFHALALAYVWNGEYAAARVLLERALSLERRALGPDHPDTIATLGAIAQTQFWLGSYAEAVSAYQRLVSLREKTSGQKSHEMAQALTGLGVSYWKLGKLRQAKALLERALAIRTALPKESPVYVAANLHNLGIILGEMGDHQAQLALELRASKIREKAWGPEHPNTANGLYTVGSVYLQTGDLVPARLNITKALEIRRKTLGPAHRDTGEALHALALIDLRQDPQNAVKLALEADSILTGWLRANIRSLSEREALSFARYGRRGLFVAMDALTHPGAGEEARRQVWDSVVRHRSMVLDEMVWRKRLPDQERLVGLRVAYSRQLLSGPRNSESSDSMAAYTEKLDRLRQDMEAAERELAVRNGPFRQSLEAGRAGFDQVIAELPKQAALISFARYDRNVGNTVQSRYGAFVASAGQRRTAFVDLARADQLDRLITAWRSQFAQEATAPGRSPKLMENAARSAGAGLRKRLWDPLASMLAGAKQVFVVPDGPLHLVNLGALPSSPGRYLLETGPLLHYLNTERDLVVPAVPTDSPGALLVVGNPEFTLRRRRPDLRASSRVRGNVACFDPKTLQFDPLPSSQAEAEQILEAWKSAGGIGHLMTGQHATEAAFRSSAPGNRILHLATHGFFYQTRCGGNDAAATSLAISGLALAGVNAHPASPDDGLLTADEVSMMALDNTDWAVLSGCETGLGRIEAGEGVFGLRRAFQLAGARTIIMSLSPVQDEWARRWMTTLYRNRLQRRMPTAEAVRTASLSLLEQRRREGLSTHPIYWTPFVAAGDWR